MSDPGLVMVVEGITVEGQTFRPGDWIDRLLETLSMYGSDRRTGTRPYAGPERRARQIAFLQAQVCAGQKCLVVDLRLRDANPQAFAFLMDFVCSNRLRCRHVNGPAG